MSASSQVVGLLEYLRDEVQRIKNKNKIVDISLRRQLLEQASQTFSGRFPFYAYFRGHVAEVRDLKMPNRDESEKYLELIPHGYSRDMHAVFGGILIPQPEDKVHHMVGSYGWINGGRMDLHAGSVLKVAVGIFDPLSYELRSGLLSEIKRCEVQVAVRP
jgi:hypothetical protein